MVTRQFTKLGARMKLFCFLSRVVQFEAHDEHCLFGRRLISNWDVRKFCRDYF